MWAVEYMLHKKCVWIGLKFGQDKPRIAYNSNY